MRLLRVNDVSAYCEIDIRRSGNLGQPGICIRAHALPKIGERIHRFFHERSFLWRDKIIRHRGHAHFKFAAPRHFRDFRPFKQMTHCSNCRVTSADVDTARDDCYPCGLSHLRQGTQSVVKYHPISHLRYRQVQAGRRLHSGQALILAQSPAVKYVTSNAAIDVKRAVNLAEWNRAGSAG